MRETWSNTRRESLQIRNMMSLADERSEAMTENPWAQRDQAEEEVGHGPDPGQGPGREHGQDRGLARETAARRPHHLIEADGNAQESRHRNETGNQVHLAKGIHVVMRNQLAIVELPMLHRKIHDRRAVATKRKVEAMKICPNTICSTTTSNLKRWRNENRNKPSIIFQLNNRLSLQISLLETNINYRVQC